MLKKITLTSIFSRKCHLLDVTVPVNLFKFIIPKDPELFRTRGQIVKKRKENSHFTAVITKKKQQLFKFISHCRYSKGWSFYRHVSDDNAIQESTWHHAQRKRKMAEIGNYQNGKGGI